jgi:hypothetical protein
MKHATQSSLIQIAELISRLREFPGLVERKTGTFYRRSSAYCHFHEDPAGLFTDIKLDGKVFERFPVNNARERSAFLSAAKVALRGTAGNQATAISPRGPAKPAARRVKSAHPVPAQQ